MIRLGIIGLGWWGKQIAICLTGSPRFKIVAGCDIDTAMAAPFAAEKKFDLVSDYKTLLARSDCDRNPSPTSRRNGCRRVCRRQACLLREATCPDDGQCRTPHRRVQKGWWRAGHRS